MELNEILGEDLYKQVSEKLGDKKVFVNDGTYIPKQKFDEVNTSKNQLKEQVGQLSTQLESLKQSAKGNTELESKITELQKTNKDWETKYQDTLITSALKLEAVKYNAINPEDVLAFVNKANLSISEDGKIKGLTDEFTTLKKNKSYLFKGITNNPGTNPAGQKSGSEDVADKLKKSFGL